MDVKFFVSHAGDLNVQEPGKRNPETLIRNSRGWLQTENRDKAAEYLRDIAQRLGELFDASEQETAADLLREAEDKIDAAKLAEKCCQPVEF